MDIPLCDVEGIIYEKLIRIMSVPGVENSISLSTTIDLLGLHPGHHMSIQMVAFNSDEQTVLLLLLLLHCNTLLQSERTLMNYCKVGG